MSNQTDATNTPDEIIDLVDENDQIIGEITKGEANRDPSKIHREVCVILFDKDKRILLQQRSFQKKVYPGYWIVSAAGHIPKGMTPLESIHKELEEELGFDTDVAFLKKEFLTSLKTETIFEYWYTALYNGETIKPDAREIEQIRWISEKELDQMLLSGEQVEQNCVRTMKELWSSNE